MEEKQIKVEIKPETKQKAKTPKKFKQNSITHYWRVKEPQKEETDGISNQNHNEDIIQNSPVEEIPTISQIVSVSNGGGSNNPNHYSTERYKLQFDGGSRGNPGPSGSGTVIYNSANEIIWSNSSFYHHQTNNYAEYMGLIKGLEKAVELGIENIKIEGDSQLVIQQVRGIYKCKHPNILSLCQRARELASKIRNIEYAHIYRHLNKVADALANCGMDKGFTDRELKDRGQKDILRMKKKRKRGGRGGGNKKNNGTGATNPTIVTAPLGVFKAREAGVTNGLISPISVLNTSTPTPIPTHTPTIPITMNTMNTVKHDKKEKENKEKKEKIIKKRRRVRKKNKTAAASIPKIEN